MIFRFLSWILEYFDITKTVDGQDVIYLRRFFLWRGKNRRVFLHAFLRSDDDPEPHDHPFDFTSIILSGGYIDENWGFVVDGEGYKQLAKGYRLEANGKHFAPADKHEITGHRLFRRNERVLPWSIVKRRAEHIHRVILDRGTAWTIVIAGPDRRPWYFIKEDRKVWWREYLGVWETGDARD